MRQEALRNFRADAKANKKLGEHNFDMAQRCEERAKSLKEEAQKFDALPPGTHWRYGWCDDFTSQESHIEVCPECGGPAVYRHTK